MASQLIGVTRHGTQAHRSVMTMKSTSKNHPTVSTA
jgi:hypothetical protein